ncbi:hypothetical protein RclHR1_04130010 [Rhizophagus clarus]|uniref:Uncharacterized protein n=1 Tax=Rhizophagus clarus TaxID=94130 RepID=A0A2Z6RGU7_9GLOM|nr:hypothetical protein RclHR1_04130010 [Rhizophagus clarus]
MDQSDYVSFLLVFELCLNLVNMPKGGLPEVTLSQTRYREFWEKPISQWSSESWEDFFSKKFSTQSKQASHIVLKSELEVLIRTLNPGTRALAKANRLLKDFKKNLTSSRRTVDLSPSLHTASLLNADSLPSASSALNADPSINNF